MTHLRPLVLVAFVIVGCSRSHPTDTGPPPAPAADPATPLTVSPLRLTSQDAEPPVDREAEAAAVAAVRAAGGRVETDGSWQSVWFQGQRVPDSAFRDLVLLTRLKSISLTRAEVSDAGLRALPPLPNLRILDLTSSRGYTDAGLRALPALPALRVLDLTDTPVTDDGLAGLVAFTGLEELRLDKTAVTDAGLKHLAPLANLVILELGDTKVTGTGFKQLAPLTKLFQLQLDRSAVTDAGLSDLPPSVLALCLNGTRITDEGVRTVVRKHPNLTSLRLDDTRLTDDGVVALAPLKGLQYLTIRGCRLSPAGTAEAKKLANGRVHGP